MAPLPGRDSISLNNAKEDDNLNSSLKEKSTPNDSDTFAKGGLRLKKKLGKPTAEDINYISKISKCNIMTLEELALDESSIVGRKGHKQAQKKSRHGLNLSN